MQEICIIIPCFNEEIRLDKQALLSFIQENRTVNICLVNDGSRDGTLVLLYKIKEVNKENILVIDLPLNAGKAEAVRKGMAAAAEWKAFQYLAYLDADFATPLSEVASLSEAIKVRHAMFAIGSRVKRLGATVERSVVRHYFGRVFATCASILLDLPVYDTQCGAKIINREWMETAFSKPFISSWLFDVEILARLRNQYGKEQLLRLTVEVPLNTWIEKGGSKIKLSHLLRIPLELLKIHFKYNR